MVKKEVKLNVSMVSFFAQGVKCKKESLDSSKGKFCTAPRKG